MNEAIKQKWIEALRSGKYKQGRGSLRSRERYCCLGVLCDVVDPTMWVDGIYAGSGMLTLTGLSCEAQRKLVNFNDNDGLSFNEIADYIEREL